VYPSLANSVVELTNVSVTPTVLYLSNFTFNIANEVMTVGAGNVVKLK
jgi:hypothetical protein